MKQTMSRDICAQIDTRLVALFDSIPDAGNKTPTEFFSAVFSDEASSRKALNNWPRTFVHNIMASKIPASEEMALAIIELILTKHRYLDGLINVGDNLVALACESGSTARIESVLRTGAGRGRIAEIDDQGRLKILKTSTDNLQQLEVFFREWRSVGKNKSLFDYLIDPKVGPNLSKVHSDSWKTLERIFPDKVREINQLRGYNPDLLINAYRLGGVNKLEQALRTSSGIACLTEVDAEGKLKIFGSKLERFSELEEYFRKLIFNPNNMCFLDICLAAESRKDDPVQFHPSVWQLLRKIFVANINKIQEAKKDNTRWRNNSSEAENDFIYNDLPESAAELNKKTENNILNGFEESLAEGTPEAALRAFAVDAAGRTPLHLAAEQGNVDLVAKILASQVAIDSVYVNTAVLFRNAHPDCLAKMFEDPKLVKLAYHALGGSDYNYTLVKEIFARDRSLLNEAKVAEFVNAGNAEALRTVAEIDKELFVRTVIIGVRSEMCPSDHRYRHHFDYYDEKTFPKLKTLFGLIRDHAPELLNSFFAVRGGNGLGVMHYAAYVGDVDFVRSMYATDAGKVAISDQTEHGITPLRMAIYRGNKDNLAVVEELLQYPEVAESVAILDKNQSNIFHSFEGYKLSIDPEVLKFVLRMLPESRKLLAQKDGGNRSPVLVFLPEHLQAIIEVNNELQDLSIISGCEADLITLSIRCKNLALLPAIAATEAGQAALKALDSGGILPLTSALHSGDLELVKQLLQYPAVQESIEILDDRQESVFNASRFYYGAKPISPEILEYVLENYLQSRKLLSGIASKNPVADFSIDTLKVALKYSEGAEALFVKGRGDLCFAQEVIKAFSTSNQYQHVGSQEKAQVVIEALKNYPDRDKARAIFTQKINGKKFIDTLNDEQRAIIPIELITLELDLGTIAAFVGMIRCASSPEQARAALNAPDENGLSVYSRLSREQRAILDSAFTVSPAVHSVLAATEVALDTATATVSASSTSLQTGAHGNADGVVVVGSPSSLREKRRGEFAYRDDNKSPRNGAEVPEVRGRN